ncbi:hypothetical protein [Streptomyces bohaiensis]|uniref:Glycosyltransferase family 29 (Sialyltransferase) n=1 Tax=Streptomyces bohaiensis TaxID=1431344 RepID=A0ABX1CD72_9ACTN|nr:hypothetical protein [Streptomyces bohaiensis]NJQ15815.1 hypothetical protein [Streptomyces bohaiensis]
MQLRIGKPARRQSAAQGERPPADDVTPELARRVRDCAIAGGQQSGNPDPERVRFAEAVRVLLTAYAEAAATPGKAATLLGGGNRWAGDHPEVFEALLQAGRAAAAVGTEDLLRLALRVTDTLLEVRAGSRAAWRLRARVLEGLGDDARAVEAHERYLALCVTDDHGTGARIDALRAGRDRLVEALALLRRRYPRAAALETDGDRTDLWSDALTRRDAGDATGAAERMTAALGLMVADRRPYGELGDALTAIVDLLTEFPPDGGEPPADLLTAWAEHCRLSEREAAADPLLGGARVIGLSDLRNQLAGRSICLVANSRRVAEGRYGTRIDDYDLVVRFNSFTIDAPATGTRTDIHATIHKHNFNWDVPVTTRLVFGGRQAAWQHSLRRRLVPGAQRNVGDRTLRWPVREIGRLTEEEWPTIPTSGFNMLWLLDFLDVSTRIDLIGFDFYASGAYRLPGAMKLPITSVHGYQRERDWVTARARHTDEMRTSLR